MAEYRSYVQAIKRRIREVKANRLAKAAQMAADAVRDAAPRRSGRLVGNITLEIQARGTRVRAVVGIRRDAFYSRFLEFGTKRMAAKPFFRPTLQRLEPEIRRLISEEWQL